MILKRYLRAETVEECVQLLSEWGEEAALLAGGTDLIPQMRQGKRSVPAVIDLDSIRALSHIEKEGDGLVIGSMLRLRTLEKESRLTGALSVLRQCAGHVSNMQVRNVATLGGNVCHASPAADTVPGLLVLDAVARIHGAQGARELPLEDFFRGPGETALQRGEILTGLFIPPAAAKTGAVYRKYAIRGNNDISIVGVGAKISLDAKGQIAGARIALASMGPTPLRMKREEQMLIGKRPEEALFREIAASCAGSCHPVTDHRATAAYRKDMARLWTEDALKGAFSEALKAQ